MGSKSAPPPPDYTGAAREQGESSKEVTNMQTFANRPTQITPWGKNTWTPGTTIDPVTGKTMGTWESELTLSPAEQAALESQQQVSLGRSDLAAGLIGRTSDELQDPFAWQSLPDAGAAPTVSDAARRYDMSGQPELVNPDLASLQNPNNIDYSALPGLDTADFSSLQNPNTIDYNSLTALNNPDFASLNVPQDVNYGALPGLDASGGYNPNFAQTAYDRSASLLEPRNQRALEAQDNQLRNQGLVPGTEAYDNAMGDLQDQQGETMSRLAQDSMFAGADLQDRQFGRETTTRGIYGDEAQQQFGNESYIRDLLAGEQQQQFANTAQARAMDAAEAQQGFGNEAYIRDLLAGEQQQQFANSALARDTMGAEAQQQFGNEAYIRNLLGQDMQQQFANTGTARELYAREMGQGIEADLAAGQQQFGQSVQAANYQNQLRQQALAEEAQRRGISINEMNALLTGQQVATPQMPNFQAAQSAEAAQYLRGAESEGNFLNDRYRTALSPVNSALGMVQFTP
tara:strand:+ start:6811 stop:8358 length:1548 start_codon:yes stop_codon:yes gene_type:complete